MRGIRSFLGRLLLLALLAGGVFATFRHGLIPQQFNPLPTLTLDAPGGLLVDWQLAALQAAPDVCRGILQPPYIEATAIRDNPLKNGCGWSNGVRVATSGGARIGVEPLSCEVAAAFSLWMAHEVQPLALSLLGKRVTAVQTMGTYACRNIIGNTLFKDMRSQHATANAIDIGGFTLEDGRQVNVLRDWKGSGPEAAFLRAVHQSGCRYFRVALGPEYNKSHADHFHFDRGWGWRCV